MDKNKPYLHYLIVDFFTKMNIKYVNFPAALIQVEVHKREQQKNSNILTAIPQWVCTLQSFFFVVEKHL